MNNKIVNKTILITGASRGIGRAIAGEMLKQNCGMLMLSAKNEEKLEAVRDELMSKKRTNQDIVTIASDLSKPEGVLDLAGKALSLGKNIDICVNNAGYTSPKSIFEDTAEDFIRTLNINLIAPFILVKSIIQHKHQLKYIVNVASTSGMRGREGWGSYSSSKAALIALGQAWREELIRLGTRVITVSPGRCATDLRKTLAPAEDPSTIMQPSDVAEALSMLISDAGAFVDSENLVIRLQQ